MTFPTLICWIRLTFRSRQNLSSVRCAISMSNVGDGLSFRLPAATLGFALAAFGITGISFVAIVGVGIRSMLTLFD